MSKEDDLKNRLQAVKDSKWSLINVLDAVIKEIEEQLDALNNRKP